MSDQLPEEFLCPISTQMMDDPVILPCGHTFDRPHIRRSLEARPTCPMTNLDLPNNPSLVSNLTLQSYIHRTIEIWPMKDQLPPDFLCPISGQIMKVPVVLPCGHTFDLLSFLRWPASGHLPCGHTFDRLSIQQRPDAGNRTCPMTNLPLPDKPFLVPNLTLRSLISGVTPIHPLSQPELELVAALASSSSTVESKLEALGRLNELSKHDPDFRRRLTESDIVSVVLDYVDSDNGFLRERALSLLLNLSFDDDNKVELVADEVISKVVSALRAYSANCRALAAKIFTNLAAMEVNNAAIGEHPFAISALLSVMSDVDREVKKEAAKALVVICKLEENREQVAVKGSVPILIEAARSGLEEAVEVLAMLAKCGAGREVMGSHGECVRVLVKVLNEGGWKGIEWALLALNSLCRPSDSICGHSDSICREVRSLRVLETCARLQRADDMNIKKKAAALAQLLRTNSIFR